MTIFELREWQLIVDKNFELNYGSVVKDEFFLALPPNLKRSLLKHIT